ncbi:MAG: type VII secretion-associated serine protease mycosin [Pseudonocardiaceae bacterium]
MRRHRTLALACLLAATATQVLGGAATAQAAAAPPAGACHDPNPGRSRVPQQPWAQQVLNPMSTWAHSRGAGVLVAVVDSGVDADHPQLSRAGKVQSGRDFFLTGTFPGNFDCASHGTGVASIIAADPLPAIGFHGIAPDATILPVRISDRDVGDRGETLRIDPQVLANGIRYAADSGAKVINLSLAGYDDFPVVRAAVAHAVAKDALVVTAAGNGQRDGGAELPSYPAAYDGVLGVGAVDINGATAQGSQIGHYVDIVAPGAEVLAATRVDGHAYADGTSFATPFVAATAALVRAAWPKLTASEVAQRLIATASPARGGLGSTAYGAGLVNPYRAVTDGMDTAGPAALPVHVPVPPDQAHLAQVAWHERVGQVAKWLAARVACVIVLITLIAVIRPLGRRRRWQPGWAPVPPAEPAVIEPPEQIFLVTEQ